MYPQVEFQINLRQTVRECLNVREVCQNSVAYCLERGGEYAEPAHVGLLLDCADICLTSADFMLRSSPLLVNACGLCAEACERCAKSCESFRHDEMMQQCAQACRNGADACRQVVG